MIQSDQIILDFTSESALLEKIWLEVRSPLSVDAMIVLRTSFRVPLRSKSLIVIIAIMQPYLFPYIGYFQLISHCDVLVIHDDVQYISGGWINRNRILVNGKPSWITVPVRSASHKLEINQRLYDLKSGSADKLIRRLASAYHSAPWYESTLAVISAIFENGNVNVADFNTRALYLIAGCLDIRTPILRSSQLPGLAELKGIDRVIAICKALGASSYVNPIGGVSLYPQQKFAAAGLNLLFLQATPTPYLHLAEAFVPFLSIIDVMMHNDRSALASMLGNYKII